MLDEDLSELIGKTRRTPVGEELVTYWRVLELKVEVETIVMSKEVKRISPSFIIEFIISKFRQV